MLGKKPNQSFILSRPFLSAFKSSRWILNSRNLMKRIAILVIAGLFVATSFHQHTFNIERSVVSDIRDDEKPTTTDQNWRSLLPRKMWQICLAPSNSDSARFQIDSGHLADAVSWLAHNPGYTYVLIGDKGTDAFLREIFENNQALSRIFKDIKNTGMKSDLLRYLILSLEGGIYSDIDTVNLKPIDLWVPEKYQKDARAVIGVEFDRLNGKNWGEVHHDLQFCQWTIAAAPGHPLFMNMIERGISSLEVFTEARNTTFSELEVSSAEVMKLTGPSAWTDAVFQQLQEYDPELTSLRNMSGLVEPKLVGDILILPIDGFGMGQKHSNSTNDGSIPEEALVKHSFRGLWKHHNKNHKGGDSHDADTGGGDNIIWAIS